MNLEGRPKDPATVPRRATDETPGLFTRPSVIRLLKWGGLAVAAVLVGIDVFLHHHEYVGLEWIPGYYLAFGFVASVVMIIASKLAGTAIKRKVDHYDNEADDA